MSSTDEPDHGQRISPAELQEIVKVFADSDVQELRLSVGAVDLLISRNEQVDVPARAVAPARGDVAQRAAAPAPAPAPAPPTGTAATAAGAGAATDDDSGPSPAPAPQDRPRDGLSALRSPALGTFYRRPAPDQAPFVEVGASVAVGDPVGTIEVMKMFTTVTSDVAGTVVEICVDDAALVEHGQVVLYVEPAKA